MNPALLAAIPSILQGVLGATQISGGNRQLAEAKRPTYNMPGEIGNAATLAAQQYAEQDTIGETRARADQRMATSNAVGAASNVGGLGGIVASIVANANSGANSLMVSADAERRRRLSELQNMQQVLAGFRDQEFQLNKFAPYSDMYQESRQRIGAGQQNLFSALNGLSSISQFIMASGGFKGIASDATSSVDADKAAEAEFNATLNAILD